MKHTDKGQSLSGTCPIRVLSKVDLQRRLEEVLENLQEMDSVLPELGQDVELAQPLILFSGWAPDVMLETVRQLRAMDGLHQAERELMAAMAHLHDGVVGVAKETLV